MVEFSELAEGIALSLLEKFSSFGFDLGLDLYYSPVENPNWQKVIVDNSNSATLEDCE